MPFFLFPHQQPNGTGSIALGGEEQQPTRPMGNMGCALGGLIWATPHKELPGKPLPTGAMATVVQDFVSQQLELLQEEREAEISEARYRRGGGSWEDVSDSVGIRGRAP